jgi:predicted nucleic acid-binding protein
VTDYLLDTNHISPLVTIEHPLRAKILAQIQAGDTFSIATPALGEFLFGIGMLPRAERNMREWERLKQDFIYYSVD